MTSRTWVQPRAQMVSTQDCKPGGNGFMDGGTAFRAAVRAPYHHFRALGRGIAAGFLLLLTGACATPSPPTLAGTTWQWQETRDGEAVVLAPRADHPYLLNFRPAGELTGRVDCNRLNGRYREKDGRLRFDALATTRAFCGERSRDWRYLADLERTAAFHRQGTILVLILDDGRKMRFLLKH